MKKKPKERLDMDIPDILAELEVSRGHFPRRAVKEAIRKREAIVPELLKIIDYTTENAAMINEQRPDYMSHIYAMYLLAQFREKTAYGKIGELLRLPGDVAMEICGDFVTGGLCRVLASVSEGDDAPMKALVENQDMDQYIRDAALRGIVALAACGATPRGRVIEYFRELYTRRLEKRPSVVWCGLVACSADLYPEDLMAEIRQAYEADLVSMSFIKLDSVERELRAGRQKVLDRLAKNRCYALIDDTVKEMEWWACFQPGRR